MNKDKCNPRPSSHPQNGNGNPTQLPCAVCVTVTFNAHMIFISSNASAKSISSNRQLVAQRRMVPNLAQSTLKFIHDMISSGELNVIGHVAAPNSTNSTTLHTKGTAARLAGTMLFQQAAHNSKSA